MSGFVGILNLDGAPVDRRVLQDLTSFLEFRGPDARATWSDPCVGLGHALLRTTFESEHERQPLTLDGRVWIAADARIDDRQNLISELCGAPELVHAPDPELILRAYLRWGDRCLDHLIGDFSFAIWDAPGRRLFCARDHLGVRPFFYAFKNPSLIFSNSIRSIRQHPAVTNRLDDIAIADFLLFEWIQDADATSFADIRRLPPGHTLVCGPDGAPLVRKYWTMPEGREIRYRRPSDYIERFQELMIQAVGDRLRTAKASIFLSGGLDSPTIAAFARRSHTTLHGFSVVYDHVIPDDERHFSGLVANQLDLPIHYLSADDYRLYERADDPSFQTPEPAQWPLRTLSLDERRLALDFAPVVLTGEGGDEAFRPSTQYAESMLRSGRLICLCRDVFLSFRLGQGPRGLGLRNSLRRSLRNVPTRPWCFPDWIEPSLEAPLSLRKRWDRVMLERPGSSHAHRSEARRSLCTPVFRYAMAAYDADWSNLAIEFRHPFLDLRLLRFLANIPSVPWCNSKQLLREAMRSILPAPVLARPKTPVRSDPVLARIADLDSRPRVTEDPHPMLLRYVRGGAITQPQVSSDMFQLRLNLHPVSLGYWVTTVQDSRGMAVLDGLSPVF